MVAGLDALTIGMIQMPGVLFQLFQVWVRIKYRLGQKLQKTTEMVVNVVVKWCDKTVVLLANMNLESIACAVMNI